uniref:PIH1 domain-containing protein 2 n=1 Tax=Anolis carolinensis TaxID=28377 RepID=H9GMA5_ANOCA
MEKEEVLGKAAQLWTMLDDLAESQPEKYRQFMQQQMKEARQHLAPPEPHLCLKAHRKDNTAGKTLFVNVCAWKRVPAPQSPSERVPFTAGKMEELSDKSGPYSIVDIAFHPSVLEKGKNDPKEKDRLMCLCLKYIEEHYSVTVSPSYSILKFKLKGSLERMRQSLRREQVPAALSQKDVTLDQLRNIIEEEEEKDLLLLRKNQAPAKPGLIEEIPCAEESPRGYLTPAYEIATTKDANGDPVEIELRVELPEVDSVSECDLRVSKDDVLIECLNKYRLRLDLPEMVNEEATAAIFHKKKGVLVITMPVRPSKW